MICDGHGVQKVHYDIIILWYSECGLPTQVQHLGVLRMVAAHFFADQRHELGGARIPVRVDRPVTVGILQVVCNTI